jgi:hypothetical protein
MAKKQSTHLYVVSCGELLKIGVTNDIDKRIKSLQTGNPFPIVLEYIEERYKPHKAETFLHRSFQDRCVSGEWFRDLTIREIRGKLMMFFDQECENYGNDIL